MRRAGVWIVVAWLSGSVPAWPGQEAPQVPPPGQGPSAEPLPASPPEPQAALPGTDGKDATEVTLGQGTGLAAGIGFSHPLGASFRVQILHGLSADVRDEGDRVEAVCALPIPHCAQGFLFEVEAGSGGGKLSLGLGARARVDEEDFHGTFGVGLRASLARTWGSPFGTEPGLTYAGPELDLSIKHVDLGVGVLWRVSGDAGPSALFSWRVGFGL